MDRKKLLGIPVEHTLEKTGGRQKGTLLQTDVDEYEERDAAGELVAKHVFTEHTEIKTPFDTTHSYVSYAPDGRLLCESTTFDPAKF